MRRDSRKAEPYVARNDDDFETQKRAGCKTVFSQGESVRSKHEAPCE